MNECEEADRLEEAPHPRETFSLYGHAEAERQVLEAYRGGRMHHAWLIHGAQGIGKATLAYRIARFLLAHPKPGLVAPERTTLDLAPDHRVSRQVAAMAHPDLFVLNRAPNPERKMAVPTVIPVDYVRNVTGFFASTASAGGWRICIVDSADEMNAQAANALLKVLEEPPLRSVFLLVNHVAGRLLPTIRSRCRLLPLKPLNDDAMRVALADFAPFQALGAEEGRSLIAAANGAVRDAMALAMGGEAEAIALLARQFAALPTVDWGVLHGLSDRMGVRDDRLFDLFIGQIQQHLCRHVAMHGSHGARALAPYAEVWEKVETGAARVRAFNLDRRPFVFSAFGWLADLKAGR